MSENQLVPYSDVEKMSKAVVQSGLFGVKTESQAISIMLIAQAYGKHPMQAAIEYNIINNRPAKKAEAILAAFQEAGGKVKWIELTEKKAEAEFSHPSGGTLVLAWTIEMAKQAGLVDKDFSNYKKYPRAMLRSRVVAEGVRAVYPAATGGMLSKEEAEDIGGSEENDGKSRVEKIIEAEATHQSPTVQPEHSKDTQPLPKPEKAKTAPKSEAKAAKENVTEAEIVKQSPETVTEAKSEALPEGHKVIVGLIDNEAKGADGEIIAYKTINVINPATKKAEIKHS